MPKINLKVIASKLKATKPPAIYRSEQSTQGNTDYLIIYLGERLGFFYTELTDQYKVGSGGQHTLYALYPLDSKQLQNHGLIDADFNEDSPELISIAHGKEAWNALPQSGEIASFRTLPQTPYRDLYRESNYFLSTPLLPDEIAQNTQEEAPIAILPRIKGTSLHRAYGQLTLEEAISVLSQTALQIATLAYGSSEEIQAHHDLKIENILVDTSTRTPISSLIDLEPKPLSQPPVAYTHAYAAPELLDIQSVQAHETSDVFSLAGLAIELITKRTSASFMARGTMYPVSFVTIENNKITEENATKVFNSLSPRSQFIYNTNTKKLFFLTTNEKVIVLDEIKEKPTPERAQSLWLSQILPSLKTNTFNSEAIQPYLQEVIAPTLLNFINKMQSIEPLDRPNSYIVFLFFNLLQKYLETNDQTLNTQLKLLSELNFYNINKKVKNSKNSIDSVFFLQNLVQTGLLISAEKALIHNDTIASLSSNLLSKIEETLDHYEASDKKNEQLSSQFMQKLQNDLPTSSNQFNLGALLNSIRKLDDALIKKENIEKISTEINNKIETDVRAKSLLYYLWNNIQVIGSNDTPNTLLITLIKKSVGKEINESFMAEKINSLSATKKAEIDWHFKKNPEKKVSAILAKIESPLSWLYAACQVKENSNPDFVDFIDSHLIEALKKNRFSKRELQEIQANDEPLKKSDAQENQLPNGPINEEQAQSQLTPTHLLLKRLLRNYQRKKEALIKTERDFSLSNSFFSRRFVAHQHGCKAAAAQLLYKLIKGKGSNLLEDNPYSYAHGETTKTYSLKDLYAALTEGELGAIASLAKPYLGQIKEAMNKKLTPNTPK